MREMAEWGSWLKSTNNGETSLPAIPVTDGKPAQRPGLRWVEMLMWARWYTRECEGTLVSHRVAADGFVGADVTATPGWLRQITA
jgi:hypothetical protein